MTALWCSGGSSTLAWLDTGHSSTDCLKKSGPLCYASRGPGSVGFFLQVTQSAMFKFPATQNHSCGLVLNFFDLLRCVGIEAVAFLAYHGLNYFAVYNVINNSESVSGLSWSENSQSLASNSATQLKAQNYCQ